MRRLSVALVLALAAACQRADEPMAGDKPLSHWKKEAQKVSFMTFWNSSKDERRHEAFRRLSEIGEPAVPALVDLFKKNRTPVSGDAFNALANLGPRAASAVPAMIELLGSDNAELRRRAAWILGTIGPAAEPAVSRLASLLKDSDERLREAAARALGQIGGSGLATLEQARVSNNVMLREGSMRGLAALPLDPADRREYLAGALRDPHAEVRLRALDLLMTAKPDEAEALAKYLVKALNDPDPAVNKTAHTVLNVYLQHGNATPVLLAAVLAGGDDAARADAAWHLGARMSEVVQVDNTRSDPTVMDALVGALDAPDAKVRLYAGRALAYGEGRAREQGLLTLRRELPNVEPILAVRAARVLWDVEHNVAEVRPVYEAGLRDPEKWNRVETMSAIMHMGPAGDVFAPEFERLRNDPSPEVRDRADKALYAIRRRNG